MSNIGIYWSLVKDLSNETPSQSKVYALARITDSICLAGTVPDGQIWRSIETYEKLDDFQMTLEAVGPKLDDFRMLLQAHDGTELRDLSLDLAAYNESIISLEVVNWNIDENRIWFVRLSDTGSAISVEMYLTQSDAEAQTNLQASGESSGYGEELEIILENEEDAETPVSSFYDDLLWHVIVAGQGGSPKIFKVKEFIEMDEISHAIYRNSALITLRATQEINAHTCAKIIRNTSLSAHIPTLEVGEVVQLNSTRRGVNDLNQVAEFQIIGTINSLVNDQVELMKYVALKR